MDTMPSIIFEINYNLFSIQSRNVHSIIKLPEITPLPESKDFIRGIFEYRDVLYNLIDFRKTLEYQTISEEIQDFNQMIDQREQDHINWLSKLCESVQNNEKFNLTTDPHNCAFGKWYDNYESSNFFINDILKKFDQPHKNIHSIACEIEKMKLNGKYDEAKSKIINTKHTELASMKKLFVGIKDKVAASRHELAILFDVNSKKFALAVDKIRSVEDIADVNQDKVDREFLEFHDHNLLVGLGENSDKEIIIKVSDEYFA